MALTQISTAGVKDDAVTSGKIPANAVGSSELANNAVDTAAIADDAVTAAKLADGTITSTQIAAGTIGTGVIADQAVTLAKLPHGTSSNNGKFLRANNGADPTFETVNTDLVSDTSPQLGGNLDCNGREILLDDSNAIKIGDGSDLRLIHDGTNSEIKNYTGTFYLFGDSVFIGSSAAGEPYFKGFADGAAELYHNSSKKFETSTTGVTITGDANWHDSGKAEFGGGADLKLYHDGNHSYIENTTGLLIPSSTGGIYMRTDDLRLQSSGGSETYATLTKDGAVSLNYDNSTKFQTTTNGVKIVGQTDAGGGATSGNIQMVHTDGRKNTIGNNFDTGSYDSRIEFGVSDGSTSGGTNRVASISYAGISFGTDTASANRLDDYEEGNWTPQMYDNSGINVVLSVTSGDCFYRKVGSLVYLSGVITRNETGSRSGMLTMSHLPFTSNSAVSQLACGSWWMDRSFGNDTVGGTTYIPGGSTRVHFTNPTAVHTNAGGDDAAKSATRYLEYSQWQHNKHIYFNILYST